VTIAELPRPRPSSSHGRLAARVADDFTFENVRGARRRRALRRRSRRAGEGRGARLRPALRLGALRGRAAESSSPTTSGSLCELRGPDTDVELRVVQRGRPRESSSPRATTRGRTTDSRSSRRPAPRRGRSSWPCSSGRSRATAAPRSTAALRGRGAAGLVERYDRTRYERFIRRTVDLDALRAADATVLVDPMWAPGRAGSAACSREAGPRDRAAHGAQPYFGASTRADPAEHRRGARIVATGGFDLGSSSTGTPTAAAIDERASSFTSSRCTACSCTTWSSIADARAGGQERQRDLDGRTPRRAVRIPSTRRRWLK